MGGNSIEAKKGRPDYRTVGEIEGVPVVDGTGHQHNLPFLSADGRPCIKLHPDGTFQQMRFYGENGRPTMDLDYHPESSIEKHPSQKPIFHYHEWTAKGSRLGAKPATRELYERYKPYLKGVVFDEERYN